MITSQLAVGACAESGALMGSIVNINLMESDEVAGETSNSAEGKTGRECDLDRLMLRLYATDENALNF